jgi:hypothetical protein
MNGYDSAKVIDSTFKNSHYNPKNTISNHPWHVTLDLFEETSLIVSKLKTLQQYLIIRRFFEEKPYVSGDLL